MPTMEARSHRLRLAREYGDPVAPSGRYRTQALSAANHGAKGKRFGELRDDVGQETIELRLDHLVALTGPRLQARAIEHRDLASPVTDQPGVLQLPGGFGDAFTTHAEHVGDQFLGHGEFVRLQTIETQQQPPAQLLVDRMMPIAYRRLRHLGDQRLGVAQQEVHRRTETPELILEQFGLEPESVPGALHHRAAGRGLAAHEQGYAENPLVTYDSNFSGRAIFHDVQQRKDGCGGEVDVAQLDPGFIEDLAELHRHQFEVGCEPRVVAARQRRKQMILMGTVAFRCSHLRSPSKARTMLCGRPRALRRPPSPKPTPLRGSFVRHRTKPGSGPWAVSGWWNRKSDPLCPLTHRRRSGVWNKFKLGYLPVYLPPAVPTQRFNVGENAMGSSSSLSRDDQLAGTL